MKMGDVFKGGVAVCEVFGNRKTGSPRFILSDKGAFFSGLSKKQLNAASYAINNHDTLTETNRLLNLECEELKGDVEKLSERVKKLEDCLESFLIADEMIGSGINVHGGISMMTGSMDVAKKLLDK